MKITVEQLLDEFVGRWTRDEPLAVDELLVRAGPQADELAGLIDRFLERSPRREPTPDALAYVRALDDPPLFRARQAQGLKLDDLAAALSRASVSARWRVPKVRRYYQQLELGQLDASGVAASVWDALSVAIRPRRAPACCVPTAAPGGEAMFRARDRRLRHSDVPIPPAAKAEPELDEVDRLFTGGWSGLSLRLPRRTRTGRGKAHPPSGGRLRLGADRIDAGEPRRGPKRVERLAGLGE